MTNVIKSLQVDQKRVRVITLNNSPAECEQKNMSPHDHDKEQVERAATELLTEARRKAQHLIAEAEETVRLKMQKLEQREETLHEKVNAVLEEAKMRGYEAGYESGKADGLQAVEQIVHDARQLVTSSKEDYTKRLSEAEPMIVKLAIKIAGKVIGKQVTESLDDWQSLIAAVLKEVKEREDIHIHVHPSKYKMTLQHKKELQAIVNDSAAVYIYPDEKLTELGCLITTSFGTIDATVDSQLSEIKSQLLEIVEEADV